MNMIVAVDTNWGIGRDNKLLAHLPTDMKWFKENTIGNNILMGRKTLDSFPKGKPLDYRNNLVLTRNPDFDRDNCIIFNSEEAFWDYYHNLNLDPDSIWVIGGASIYKQFYKYCDKIYVTKIDADLQADTFIDNIDEDKNFKLIHVSDDIHENELDYKMCIYKRIGG